MQISSTNNLPIIADYSRQNQQHTSPGREQRKQTETSQNGLSSSQSQSIPNSVQQVRPAVYAQPLFDQQLSQTGEQARRLYQDVALVGNDVELANRLDVVV